MPSGRSVAVAVLMLAALSIGQVQPQRNPSSLYGRDTTQGVYVRDSAVAIEKFALAERMEHLKEWDKSADVYMEILRGYSDRVVPSQVDKDNKIYQYTSVAAAVQERLARWPEAGIDSYRGRYETEAATLLDDAGNDLAKLHRIYSTYFVTDSAKRAGIRLMDLYFENADFPAAAWLGDRLLHLHPALGDDRAMLLYRTAIAYRLTGNDAPAQAKLEELKQQLPGALGRVRGKDVVLAESLAAELAVAPSIVRASAGDSWPIAFGSPDRARIAGASGLGGAKLFNIEIKSNPQLAPVPAAAARREIERLNQADRAGGAMTGILPVIDSGEMFFNDNARIYAVSLESGNALPGWAETYSGDALEGRYSIKAWATPRGQQCTVTVTDTSVYAVMGMNDPTAIQLTNTYGQRGETRLVCLDRHDGRERWSASPRMLSDGQKNVDFVGSPLAVGDAVYIMARGGKGMQFDDAYVVCLDAATGKTRWLSYLCSASSGMWDFSDASGLFGQNVSHLAYSGGRLYALSNLGAVAAVDAYDGTIVWLSIYPRDVQQPNAMVGWNPRPRPTTPARPWTFNPVIVTGGKVFVLPSDGLHVLVYDAASGIEVKRIPLRMFDNADTLLGVLDDRLVLAGIRSVFCINWPNFDESREQKGNIFWPKLFRKAGFPEDSIRGRGIVTADSVYIPTAWGVHRISMKSGAVAETYPVAGTWDEDEGPGNLLVTPERLIIAGAGQVTVYADLKMAMAKLDAAVAAAPDQPEPRLRYAEIMSAAGKWDVATAKLDEAIQVLGGPGAMPPSAARDRVFNNAMSFAQRLARDNPQGNATLVEALFDRAASAAGSPAQQVNYRLTRARFQRTRGDTAAELKLNQQILSDATLRAVPVASEEFGGTRPAGAVAERAINDLIRRAGRAIYEPTDRLAAEQLAAAQAAADPAQLLALARQFPNSTSGPRAMIAAAEAYETASDPRQAAQVLREALAKYPGDPNRAQVIESLARNYLAMPNRIEVAAARLAQGAKLPGPPRLSRDLAIPDGPTLAAKTTFADAARTLREHNASLTARALPDLRLAASDSGPGRGNASPFKPVDSEAPIAGIASIVPALLNFERNDRVVAFTNESRLAVFPAGSSQPLFVSEALKGAPRGVAWLPASLLAWDAQDIALLSDQDGRATWKVAISTLPAIDVVTAPEELSLGELDAADPNEPGADAEALVPRLNGQIAIRGQRQLIVQGRLRRQMLQEGVVIHVGNGAQLAAAQVQIEANDAGGGQAPAAEQIVLVRPLSDRVIVATSIGRVVALDLTSGAALWQARVSDRAPTHLLASDDFVVARVGEDARVQLVVLDALGGQFLRRQSFGNENGAGLVPTNLALAADGTLVYLMPDRLCGKDLFDPSDQLTFEVKNRRSDPGVVFLGSTQPDHLQIVDGRIVALSDNGAYVRVHSLESGKLLRYEDADAILPTGASNWQVMMRVVGSRLYLVGTRELLSYDLQNPQHTWRNRLSTRTAMIPRDLIVTQGHVVVISEPAGPGGARRPRNAPAPALLLQAVSRAALADGRESGLLEHDVPITDPAGITGWQAVNGGLYYLTADQDLRFLRGAME